MAKAHRLSSHKAAKAPKAKLTKTHHVHGNVVKHLHGRKRAANITHRAKTVAWEPGVHKPRHRGAARTIAGHRTTRHPGTRHIRHGTGAHPRAAGHRTHAAHPTLVKRHHKPETAAEKAKIAAALRGKHHVHHGHVVHVAGHRKLSAATKARIAAALKGKHHKGHPMSPAARAKLSAALKGKHHPGHKGHKMSATARAKQSARMRGHKHPHRGVKGHHSTRRKRR